MDKLLELKTLNFHLTNKCNLVCKHCLYCSGEKDIPEMKLDEVKSIISQFAESTNCDGTINIYGGEPLLRDDIFEVFDFIISKKLHIGITTNINVNENILKKFAEVPISRISIDLDGASSYIHDWLRNKEGHFEKSVNALKYLKSKSQYISINAVMHNKNIDELEHLLDLCTEIKIDMINFYLFTPIGRGEKYQSIVINPLQWKLAYKRLKAWVEKNKPSYGIVWERSYEYENMISSLAKNLCESENFDVIDVRCDGNVYFCGLLMAVGAASIGNLLTTPLIEILKNRSRYLIKDKIGCAALGFLKSKDLNNLVDFRKVEDGIAPVCPYDWQIVAGNDELKKKFTHINL